MRFTGRSRLLALTGLIALCAFTGDIIADSIADLRGDHCICQGSQPNSQHEKAPCERCSCAVHNGTVITSTLTVDVIGAALFRHLFSFRPVSNSHRMDCQPRSIIRLSSPNN